MQQGSFWVCLGVSFGGWLTTWYMYCGAPTGCISVVEHLSHMFPEALWCEPRLLILLDDMLHVVGLQHFVQLLLYMVLQYILLMYCMDSVVGFYWFWTMTHTRMRWHYYCSCWILLCCWWFVLSLGNYIVLWLSVILHFDYLQYYCFIVMVIVRQLDAFSSVH